MAHKCKNCDSERVASISGKTSDTCSFRLNNWNHFGYVPYDVGIGGGDYVEFKYCLDCGQIQNDFPVSIE